MPTILKNKTTKKILTAVLALSPLMLPLSAEASSFTGINIFGDSLVDTGNLFSLTSLPPNPPYFNGRFSNDKIWIDTLADNLDLNPLLASNLGATLPTQGVNFGLGGATTGISNTGSDTLPGLQQQINAFENLTEVVPVDVNNSLNIIWAGANDYFQAISNPGSLTLSLAEQTTENLSLAVQSLYGVGARDFLVVNLPDLGETPFADFVDGFATGTSTQLNNLTTAHNSLLEQKLNNLNSSLTGIDIITLDINPLFRNVITNPDQFGFSDVDNSCLLDFEPGFIFNGVCDNPDEFLFWDNVHPTSATHQLVAQLAIDTLEQKERVPEPNNVWDLFLFTSLVFSWFGGSKYKFNR